jgi:hypothetical protein
MNRSAEQHLAKAESYLVKGDGWYHKAADEIVAAQEADPTLGQQQIAEWLGKSRTWVRDIVTWNTSGRPDAVAWHRGSHATRAEIEAGAEKLLRHAPLEQVERVIEKLPSARKQAIAASAGHSYHQARREYDEAEARLTPAQRKEREASAEAVTQPVRRAVAGFAALDIVGHLEQATEELRELVGDASVTKQLLRQIEKAHADWCDELEVARGMAGLEAR